MSLTVQAIYENGVLKPAHPIPLEEHAQVTVTIQPAVSLARQSAGMIPWASDVETLERLAVGAEFGIMESP